MTTTIYLGEEELALLERLVVACEKYADAYAAARSVSLEDAPLHNPPAPRFKLADRVITNNKGPGKIVDVRDDGNGTFSYEVRTDRYGPGTNVYLEEELVLDDIPF